MSENFEKYFTPEQPEPVSETGKSESQIEGRLSPEKMEKIITFAGDEEAVKLYIEAGFSKDENAIKFSKDKAHEILGQNYEFSNWPQFFSDLQGKLEESGCCGEKEIRDYQQKIHSAWMAVLDTKPKTELDKTNFLMYDMRPFIDMPSQPGPSRDAFYPIIVERLKHSPHLGIYDEKDLDKIAQRVSALALSKNKFLMTPEVTKVLVAGAMIEKILENKGQPELLKREYLPEDLDKVPKQYKKFVKKDTKKVTAIMFTDFTTLWTFEDAEGKSVIRTKKMEVEPDVVNRRLAELPDCVPKVKADFEKDIATFYIRYIDGHYPKNEESSDVVAVKKAIEELQQLDWYRCGDAHSGNFVVDDKQKAYWVDQDIFDAIVENKTYSEEQRKQAHKSERGKGYIWNE